MKRLNANTVRTQTLGTQVTKPHAAMKRLNPYVFSADDGANVTKPHAAMKRLN